MDKVREKKELYFIGYYIEGEAGKRHRNLTASVARECGLPPLHKKIPPHITLYRPFFSSDITPVEAAVRKVASGCRKRGVFRLSRFGSFGKRVVFVRAKANLSAIWCVWVLRRLLAKIPGMPHERLCWRPHVTVATKLSPDAFGRVERYLNTVAPPHTTAPFDNITIFKFSDDKRWEVYRRFALLE